MAASTSRAERAAVDVVTILVLVAAILLGPTPVVAVVAFVVVAAGRMFLVGG
jgi:hypothetical protein